VVSL
jgi:hypothetical protein